jgi:hypothetical protein
MQAIELEAIPEQHCIEVPDGVPETDLKSLFASVTEGLTDEDIERAGDPGVETRDDGSGRHQHRVGAAERRAASADRAAFERFLASSPDAPRLPGDEL